MTPNDTEGIADHTICPSSNEGPLPLEASSRIESRTFLDAAFQLLNAHRGNGLIHACRRWSRGTGTSSNFVDLVMMPPGTSIGVHRHSPDDEEFYIVISGHGKMTLGTQTFDVRAGDVIVNPPGGVHGLENCADEFLQVVVIDIGVVTPTQ